MPSTTVNLVSREPSLDSTWGVMFIYMLITTGLWGASSIQLYHYLKSYRNDSIWTKILVVTVWIIDTVHQALFSKVNYTVLVTHFGDTSVVASDPNIAKYPAIIENTLCSLVCLSVQSFYIRRVWIMSNKHRFLTLICSILAIAQFSAFMTYVSKTASIASFADLSHILRYSYAVTGTSAFVDVSLAIVMVTLLFRSRSGMRKSNSVVGRVIVYTVNTGLVCGACEVLALVSALAWPENFVYVGFVMVLPKLYLNCMLAILNSRKSLQGKLEATEVGGFSSYNVPANFDIEQNVRLPELGRSMTFTGTTTTTMSIPKS